DHEERGRARLLGHGSHDLVEEVALLPPRLGEEALAATERVEVARPGVGPRSPQAAHRVEPRAQRLELGKLRVEEREATLLEVPVRLVDGGAALDVGLD